jgi:uncharacterized protein YqeY
MLQDRLQQDLTAAMRARDELTTSTLRLAIAACKEAAVAGDEAKVLTDDEVLQLLAREVKRRDEAAEAYKGAGADDRATRELAERDVLATYLPAALTEDEIRATVDRVMADGGFTEQKQMGQAMKAVQAELGGRADGKLVAGLVKERLTG